MSNSPLGQYAPLVASAVALVFVVGFAIAVLVPGAPPAAADRLEPLAILALGWVVGSAVAVNGYKAPLTAFGQKLDGLQTKVAAIAAVPSDHPDPAAAIIAAAADPATTLGPLPAQDGAAQP